jgi:hypothetical protein
MPQGLVFGTVLTGTSTRRAGVRVILDTVTSGSTGDTGPNYIQITPVTPVPSCPPYNVAANTDPRGNFLLVYLWSGHQLGNQASSLRFRVKAFDLVSPGYRFLGSANRTGGQFGANMLPLVSAAFPAASFSGEDPLPAWLNMAADAIRNVPSGGMIRGMLGNSPSPERLAFATRININL